MHIITSTGIFWAVPPGRDPEEFRREIDARIAAAKAKPRMTKRSRSRSSRRHNASEVISRLAQVEECEAALGELTRRVNRKDEAINE